MPAFTHKNLGRYHGKANEYEAVNCYLQELSECLDNDGVRHRIEKEDAQIFPNSLVIYCSVGWATGNRKSNSSSISYGQANSRVVASLFTETLSDWGKCYVNLGHTAKLSNSDKRAFLNVPDTMGISVEPFKLNLDSSSEYIQRAKNLGKTMAHCLFEFLLSRNEQPRMMNVFGQGLR